MKRFLYLLLAATLTGGTPGPAFAEDADPADDATDRASTRTEKRIWVSQEIGTDPGAEFCSVALVPAPDGTAPREAPAASLLVKRRPAGVAEIRRLAMDARGEVNAADAARILLRAALLDCRTSGDLKVVVELPLRLDAIIPECTRHRFNYAGSRVRDGRVTHEFFADLYSKDG